MNLFFALLVGFLLAPVAAHADPFSSAIFTLLAGAGVAVGTATAIATFVAKVVFGAVLSLAGQLFAKKPGGIKPQGIQTEQTTTGDVTPQKFIVGRYACEGHAVAPAYSRDTDNRILTYILEISNIPIKGLTGRVIIDGQYTDLSVGANDATRLDFETLGFDENGNPRGWLWFFDGTQTTAHATTVANYSAHPDRPWTTNHILAGSAYAILEFPLNREVYSGLPSVRFEVDGIKLYDPRKDTTVGGSGAHRWATPSTWEFSQNPQVINYNILRGITLPTGDIYGGQVDAADLPLDNWFAAMNECDVLIGDRPQYQAGFEINVGDMSPFEVIEEMNRSSFSQISEFGGVFRARVGAPSAAVISLTDDDFVITQPSSYEPFPGLADTYNAITGTYVEPNDVWQGRSADAILNNTWETADGGRRLTLDVGLPAVRNKSQAQHLMNSYIRDQRRFRTHRMALPPSFALLEPLDTVSWTSETNGYTNKIFEVVAVEDRPTTLNQFVTVREREAGDVAWTAGDDVPQPNALNSLTPPAVIVPSMTLTGVSVDDDASDAYLPAIKIEWDFDDAPDAEFVVWQIRNQDTSVVVASGTSPASGGETTVAGVAGLTVYEVRAKFILASPSDFSGWGAVTTPAVLLGADSLVASLTNDNQTVPSETDGTSPVLTDAVTTFQITLGGVDDIANWTLSKADGPGVTSTLSGATVTVTALTNDTGYVDITAAQFAFADITKRFTLSKAKAGLPGPTQTVVFAYRRSASAPATPTGGSYNGGTLALTAPSLWSNTVPAGSNPIYITQAIAETVGGSTDSSLTWTTPAKLAQDGGDGAPGDDGAPGADGVNALTFVLSPTSIALPATTAGIVTDYGPSVSSLSVYEGETQLNFTTATSSGSLTNSSFQIYGAGVFPIGFITPGSRTDAGLNATINAASGMDSEVNGGRITFSVRIQRANGSQETFQIRQTITKSIAGVSGLNNAVVTLYKSNSLAVTAPADPTGTFTYTFATGAISGGTLNGWTIARPTVAKGDYLWAIQATAVGAGATDTITAAEFSGATVVSGTGADGDDGLNTATVYLFRAGATDTPPANPSGTFTYTFASGALSGGTLNGWTQTAPSLTEGQRLFLKTATASSATATDNIPAVEFSAAAIVGRNEQGGTGDTGDTVITGRVYFQTLQGSAPSTPSATSYNTTTGAFIGLTAGWATTQPPVSVTDTTVQEWSSGFTVTIDGVTSAQTIVFQTPSGAIQISTDIESDNFVAGDSGWQIQRDTGSAEFNDVVIRGELVAADITVTGTFSATTIITPGSVNTGQIAAGAITVQGFNQISSGINVTTVTTAGTGGSLTGNETTAETSSLSTTADGFVDIWWSMDIKGENGGVGDGASFTISEQVVIPGIGTSITRRNYTVGNGEVVSVSKKYDYASTTGRDAGTTQCNLYIDMTGRTGTTTIEVTDAQVAITEIKK